MGRLAKACVDVYRTDLDLQFDLFFSRLKGVQCSLGLSSQCYRSWSLRPKSVRCMVGGFPVILKVYRHMGWTDSGLKPNLPHGTPHARSTLRPKSVQCMVGDFCTFAGVRAPTSRTNVFADASHDHVLTHHIFRVERWLLSHMDS
jgi:hypothetical protein